MAAGILCILYSSSGVGFLLFSVAGIALGLFVFGTLGENPSSGSWAPQSHHSGVSASKFGFNFSCGPGLSFSLTAANPKSAPHPLDLTPRNSAPLAPAIPPHAAQSSARNAATRTAIADNSLAGMRRPEATTQPSSPASQARPGFELHPSAAISKGEHGQPFTISWHSQKEVAASLAWKSTLCIWGGPVLAIASLYLLLVLWDSFSL
jgi:hypothetical protein